MKQTKIIMLTCDERIDRRIMQQADSLTEAGYHVVIITKQDAENFLTNQAQVTSSAAWVYRIYRRLQQNAVLNKTILRPAKSLFCFIFGSPAQFQQKIFWPLVSQEKADIYVAHDLPMLPTAVCCAKKFNAKLVYDSHELFSEQEFNYFERRMWRAVEKKFINECDLVMTINQSIAVELKKRYHLPQVGVIQNAEKLVALQTNQKLFHHHFKLPPQASVILYQGNMSANRNLEILITALSKINDSMIHGVYLGSGPTVEPLKELAHKLKLADRIHFMPAVPQTELLSYTTSADLGVIPYLPICLNNKLCTPNKLFEYIAAGLPIISHNLVEIAKITRCFNIGDVTDFTNANKVANIITKIVSKKLTLLQMKQAAIKAREQLNWQVEGKELLSLYNALSVIC